MESSGSETEEEWADYHLEKMKKIKSGLAEFILTFRVSICLLVLATRGILLVQKDQNFCFCICMETIAQIHQFLHHVLLSGFRVWGQMTGRRVDNLDQAGHSKMEVNEFLGEEKEKANTTGRRDSLRLWITRTETWMAILWFLMVGSPSWFHVVTWQHRSSPVRGQRWIWIRRFKKPLLSLWQSVAAKEKLLRKLLGWKRLDLCCLSASSQKREEPCYLLSRVVALSCTDITTQAPWELRETAVRWQGDVYFWYESWTGQHVADGFYMRKVPYMKPLIRVVTAPNQPWPWGTMLLWNFLEAHQNNVCVCGWLTCPLADRESWNVF